MNGGDASIESLFDCSFWKCFNKTVLNVLKMVEVSLSLTIGFKFKL